MVWVLLLLLLIMTQNVISRSWLALPCRLGCKAVVLAFDDYDRVPVSKSITQANRAKSKAPYEFGEGSQLPPTIPHGFNEKLSNRIFKRRVIDMVIACSHA
jgi:hypothetical protein